MQVYEVQAERRRWRGIEVKGLGVALVFLFAWLFAACAQSVGYGGDRVQGVDYVYSHCGEDVVWLVLFGDRVLHTKLSAGPGCRSAMLIRLVGDELVEAEATRAEFRLGESERYGGDEGRVLALRMTEAGIVAAQFGFSSETSTSESRVGAAVRELLGRPEVSEFLGR